MLKINAIQDTKNQKIIEIELLDVSNEVMKKISNVEVREVNFDHGYALDWHSITLDMWGEYNRHHSDVDNWNRYYYDTEHTTERVMYEIETEIIIELTDTTDENKYNLFIGRDIGYYNIDISEMVKNIKKSIADDYAMYYSQDIGLI